MIELLRHIQPFAIAIVFLLVYLAEHIFPQRAGFHDLKHDAVNLGFGLVNALIVFGAGYYFQQFLLFMELKQIGLFNLIQWPVIPNLVLQILCIDIFMYYWHRVNHRWSFLWRFHKIHHQDRKMNSTTALRFHMGELSLSYLARLLIFPWLGIGVYPFLVYGLIFVPVVMLHHSNIRIGKGFDAGFRKLFVSPLMHRIHHSDIKYETDSNYGSVFPWWDAIFGTYRKKPVKEINFGLNDNAEISPELTNL